MEIQMFEVGSKSFVEFVNELKAEYVARKAAYDATPEYKRFDWDDNYIEPPIDPSTLPEETLKERYESVRSFEASRARSDAVRAEREFIRKTCFPLPDYWEHNSSSGKKSVTVMIDGRTKGREGPTTYMLQIAPRT